MRNYLATFAFASALCGCETVVDIDVPLKERILVINAVNNPDSVWNVKVSLSRHVLDDQPFEIPATSTVTIIDAASNSIVDELKFSASEQRYKGLFKPALEKEYLLRVVSPQYGTTQAIGYIPESVPILKVEIDSSQLYSPDGLVPVKIYFNDPPSKKNFYKVSMIVDSYYLNFQTQDTIRYSHPVYFEVDDPSLESDYNGGNNILLEDSFFDGNEHVLAIKVSAYYLHPGNSIKVKLVLSNLSEHYYKYASTLNLQKSTSGDPFAQPVLVYSNIENGLGVFGGVNQSIWKLKK